MSARGRLISFEGIDGSGKSTQARLLAEALRATGGDPLLTREPGGSPGAEEIRALLLSGEPGRWSPRTEILLFAAARSDHLERTILPALEAGRDVICDRFADSTRVYQSAAREGGGASPRPPLRALTDLIHAEAIGIEPDLTLILDVEPAPALGRGIARLEGAARAAEGRFEGFGLAFQTRLREGFLDLAREFPGRCRVIDGSGPPEAVAARVRAAMG